MNEDRVKQSVESLLAALGRDIDDVNLKDTPDRVAKSLAKMTEGYVRQLDQEMTIFPNDSNYTGIVYSGGIEYFSTCEHHLLPFFGTAHVAYIPGDVIAGLSKLARAVDIFSRRLQQQERITIQVADELEKILKPKGVAILLEGRHLCNTARGVQQFNSNMKTVAYRGVFIDDASLRQQFLEFLK